MGTGIRVVESTDRAGTREFVRLEARFHGDDPRYVPPTEADVRKQVAGRSAYTEGIPSRLFVADADGVPVARCSAWVNPRWQAANDTDAGFVGHVAFAAGAETAAGDALAAAEKWLASNGIRRALGPVDGAPLLGVGARVRAFDEEPFFPIAWTPPRIAELFAARGYEEFCPHHQYTVEFAGEQFAGALERGLDHPAATVRPVDKKRWKDELETSRMLVNEGFAGEWEFQQFNPAEFSETWGVLKPIIDPSWWLIAEVDGEPAGLCVSMPDWTPLWRSFKGRFGPLQVLRLMRRKRDFDRMGILAICLRPQFRGQGIAALMVASAYAGYRAAGLERGDYYLVDDGNASSRRLVESFGGTSTVDVMSYSKAL